MVLGALLWGGTRWVEKMKQDRKSKGKMIRKKIKGKKEERKLLDFVENDYFQ